MSNFNIKEKQFIEEYDASEFLRPNASIDTIILTIINGELQVLIVQRAEHPFRDKWSLVGGYVDIAIDKDLEAAARRKLEEKTGVKTFYLEQVYTVGNAARDPCWWSVTTVHFALIPSENIRLKAGKVAIDNKWSKIINKKIHESLAFDHYLILSHCIEHLRNKVSYTSLPAYLMSEIFSLGELQKVYENILEKSIDHKSFRRRILAANILEDTDSVKHDARKPAKLYRLKNNHLPYFFIRIIEGAH